MSPLALISMLLPIYIITAVFSPTTCVTSILEYNIHLAMSLPTPYHNSLWWQSYHVHNMNGSQFCCGCNQVAQLHLPDNVQLPLWRLRQFQIYWYHQLHRPLHKWIIGRSIILFTVYVQTYHVLKTPAVDMPLLHFWGPSTDSNCIHCPIHHLHTLLLFQWS